MLLTLEPCAHHLGGGIFASSRNFGHVWFSRRAEGQRSRTTTTSEAGDAGPPPRPLCAPSSWLPLYARTAGPPAASLSPSGGSCRGRRDARLHRPKVPGRSSPPVPVMSPIGTYP